MESKTEGVVSLLCSSMKLERDKGVVELEKSLPNLNTLERRLLQEHFLKLLNDSQNSWERKHGSLLGAKSLISYLNLDDDFDSNFIFTIKQIAQKLLTDIEVRVRLAAGEVLGSLCKKVGTEIYEESKDIVLRLIQSNLERNIPEDDSSKLEQFETGKLVEKLVGGAGSEKVCYIFIEFYVIPKKKKKKTCLFAERVRCCSNISRYCWLEKLRNQSQGSSSHGRRL